MEKNQLILELFIFTLCAVAVIQGVAVSDRVEKQVMMFGVQGGVEISDLNDNNVDSCVALQTNDSAPWFMTFELKSMTIDGQNILIKWSLECSHEHLYAVVKTSNDETYDGFRYSRCTPTGSHPDESTRKVCEFDCGAGMKDKKGFVRISHVTGTQQLCEIQYL